MTTTRLDNDGNITREKEKDSRHTRGLEDEDDGCGWYRNERRPLSFYYSTPIN